MSDKKTNGFKEFIRKTVVSLKRKPHRIPMTAMVWCFLWYSFHLSVVSNTTAKINGPGMGLYGFVTMIFSMLSLVCFMNAFPHRKKVNKAMLILMFLMVAAIIFCDIMYRSIIIRAVTASPSNPNPIAVTQNTIYILKAYNMLKLHVIFLAIACVLTALLPLYSPLIKRIKTSVAVESYGKMDAIEIEE